MEGDVISAISNGKLAEDELGCLMQVKASLCPSENLEAQNLWVKMINFQGRMLILIKEFERAIGYYQTLLDYYNQGAQTAPEIKEAETLHTFIALINLGSCYFSLKQYSEAKSCIE